MSALLPYLFAGGFGGLLAALALPRFNIGFIGNLLAGMAAGAGAGAGALAIAGPLRLFADIALPVVLVVAACLLAGGAVVVIWGALLNRRAR